MKNQFEFKPFDKVLVRDDDNQPWRANIYSHIDANNHIACVTSSWKQCIPYNEKTAHLIGTNEPYRKPKWCITSHEPNDVGECTDEELLNVIKNMIHFPIFKDLTIKKLNN